VVLHVPVHLGIAGEAVDDELDFARLPMKENSVAFADFLA
jgi:hypothetical protein